MRITGFGIDKIGRYNISICDIGDLVGAIYRE